MSDTEKRREIFRKVRNYLLLSLAAVLCLFLLVIICVKIYLATSLPASQLSQFVSSYLHQNFKVQDVDTSRGAMVLKGVRLENPSGFPRGNLATADSVVVSPQWRDLIAGRQRYRLVALNGIKINLEKNGSGAWNFEPLQRLLAARKPSGAETFIHELIVKDGAVKVEGQGVQGIGLKVYNFSTKGSLDSKLDLVFEDVGRNRYLVTGKARGGSDAAVDLALTAPALSLKNLARALKVKNPSPFESGRGALQLNASLHKGELVTDGDFSFTGVNVPAADKSYPIEGTLHFAANYSSQGDSARLENCTLTVNDLMTVNATGNVRNLKGERDFALYIDMEEVDLGTLNVVLPEEKRKRLFFGGSVRCDSLHILGNRRGLKSAVGTLQLNDGSVSKEGRMLVAGLSGTVGLFRKDADILAKGKLAVSGEHEAALLQALNMPFSATVSSKLKPVLAEIPSLSARVMGIPLTGRLSFDASKSNPLNASAKVPSAQLSAAVVNNQLKRYGVEAASGTASLAVEAVGKGVDDVNGTANLQLADVRGTKEKTPFALKKGTVSAKFQRGEGGLETAGDADLAGVSFGGKGGNARFAFRVSDKMAYLDALHGGAAGVDFSVAHLSATIPTKEVSGSSVRYPILVDLDGATVKRDKVEVGSLSGRMRGGFHSDGARKWLDGTAELAAGIVKWQGKKLGAANLNAAFSSSGGRGELSGQLLGGKMNGSAVLDPFAKELAATFQLAVTGADLAAAAGLFPKGGTVAPSGGALDLHLKGNYGAKQGLACNFDAKGSGIALTRGGKSLVSGGRAAVTGALAGGNLTLKEAVLAPSQGVAVRLKGEVKQAFTPKAEGSLAFSMPQADVNSIVDPLINLLPRAIQEATLQGTLATDGMVRFHQGAKLVEGGLAMRGARIEVPSQNLVVADLNGKLPFSFDLSGKAGSKPQETMDFSRENYPRLLARLRNAGGGGEQITIGKINLGSVETGKVTITLGAANGVTQISSLNTTLFKGSLIGKGYLRMGEKLGYRGDLLVNDVSLKTLCSAFPGIQGYISGRVDGVMSLSGEGSGLNGVTGFTHLWARKGSGEKMVVSKEFLQKLSKQKLSGFFFRTDRPYDKAEIKAMLREGDLTFDTLVIQHTNFIGVRDLSVNIAPAANRISLDHLLASIKEAATRGKATTGEQPAAEAPPTTQEFKWGE